MSFISPLDEFGYPLSQALDLRKAYSTDFLKYVLWYILHESCQNDLSASLGDNPFFQNPAPSTKQTSSSFGNHSELRLFYSNSERITKPVNDEGVDFFWIQERRHDGWGDYRIGAKTLKPTRNFIHKIWQTKNHVFVLKDFLYTLSTNLRGEPPIFNKISASAFRYAASLDCDSYFTACYERHTLFQHGNIQPNYVKKIRQAL